MGARLKTWGKKTHLDQRISFWTVEPIKTVNSSLCTLFWEQSQATHREITVVICFDCCNVFLLMISQVLEDRPLRKKKTHYFYDILINQYYV